MQVERKETKSQSDAMGIQGARDEVSRGNKENLSWPLRIMKKKPWAIQVYGNTHEERI